jgi:flavin-dependent dehydrogenase
VIDLLVVGAGPAGLATAMFGALAGLEVVVLDAREGPIDKACGEGLMPGAVHTLTALGVTLPGHPFHGIRYLDDRRSATAFFASGHGIGVRRTVLHAAMSQQAARLGVRFLHRRVTSVQQSADHVSAGGFRARYLAAADGLHSPIRGMLGVQVTTGGSPRWGLRQHFQVAPWSRLVEVHWAARSEAYVTPVSPTEVGVAVLSSTKASFAEHLSGFPRLLAHLQGAEPSGTVRGAGPLRQRTSARVAGRVLLVGDAAGYPVSDERAWRNDTRRYRWITHTLLTTRGFAQPALVPAAALLPDLFSLLVNQLSVPRTH